MKNIGNLVNKIIADKSILEEIALRIIGDSTKTIILGFIDIPFILKISSVLTIGIIQVLTEALTKELNGCDNVMGSVSACGADDVGSNPARDPNKIYIKESK
jgi:hypothetical protein